MVDKGLILKLMLALGCVAYVFVFVFVFHERPIFLCTI